MMDSSKNVQAEDSPAEKKPVVEIVSNPAPQKGLIDRALPWVIVSIVFFLVGALLTWFVVYQPKAQELSAAQAEMTAVASAATENITNLQSTLDVANADLTVAKEDLANAQATIQAQTTLLAKTELLKVIYKFQSDVNVARANLSKLDTASSRQALSFVAADLTELEKAGLDPDSLSGFKAKIEDAQANLEPAAAKSLEDMETIYSNLLLLINNLK
jgi:hypothetical protein